MPELLAQYIYKYEYQCSHCEQLPPDFYTSELYGELFEIFKGIRETLGRSISISSGYRCPDKNSQTPNSSSLSVHQWGLALDMDAHSLAEVDELEEIVEDLYPDVRMGVYRDSGSFVHIDIGYKISPRVTGKWVKRKRWYR